MPAEKHDTEQVLIALLKHPLRRLLLRLYVEEDGKLSPNELAVFTTKPLSNVSYHVRVLAKYGAVKLVDTQPCRGSVEHFYRATALIDEVTWGRAALGLRGL